ncbi:MAG: dihydroneopterin aldolase [Rhodospirillaceae bacterium]|nr:dihydroneopterin aldolase [Rhodospirillaceae bacterium]
MSGPKVKLVPTPSIADARAGIRHVFVRDLELMTSIGVHDHERMATQRVRINLDMAVFEGDRDLADDLDNVVCYEKITTAVREVCNTRHINLVETMAEEISSVCLGADKVRSVLVRVEKLDVFDDVSSVGVEIERFNPEV